MANNYKDETSISVDDDGIFFDKKSDQQIVFCADRGTAEELKDELEALNLLHGFSYSEEDFSESYSSRPSRSASDPIFISIKAPTRGASLCDDVILEDEEFELPNLVRSSTVPYAALSDEDKRSGVRSLMKKIHQPMSFRKRKQQDEFLNRKSDDAEEQNYLDEENEKEQLKEVLEEEKQALFELFGIDAGNDAEIPMPYRTCSSAEVDNKAEPAVVIAASKGVKHDEHIKHVMQQGRSHSMPNVNQLKQLMHKSHNPRQSRKSNVNHLVRVRQA